MKSLILSLLFLPSLLHALDPNEQVTSGSLGLLIPSTGYIDIHRRLDDKYNSNFRMIASTINTIASVSNGVSKADFNVANTTGPANIGVALTALTTTQVEIDNFQIAFSTLVTGGGTVENSTRAATITVGGEIVYSSATPPFFPGAWWSATASSCTITKVQAVVKNPSLASAVFPFYAVQQSSWQWSQYGVLAVTTATQRSIVKNEAIVVTSSNSFIVGVASAPVSNPASNLGLWFQYWCNP